MTQALVDDTILRPLMKDMESYLKKAEKKNEWKREAFVVRVSARHMRWWGWLKWVTVKRSREQAKEKFEFSKSGGAFYERESTIKNARHILKRLTQLLDVCDDQTLLISARHFDFLKNCDWNKI